MSYISNLFKKLFKKENTFNNSETYWKQRYRSGGNSGHGSYNKLAKFKADVLNKFVKENDISHVIELGCGDGNQLKYYNFPSYTGLDISKTAINQCEESFENDSTKRFSLLNDFDAVKAELVISIDVIYHLVEDHIFEDHIEALFGASSKYVIIYSSNEDIYSPKTPHVKHRQFTNYIEDNYPEAKLIKHVPNKYPYNSKIKETSRADFFIYRINEI